ncbi:chitosanase [Pseudonocardia kujensis]|uniref:chitosanase n=1 Tax=Pseudonocardia kujensis TaxID=1128675 RepID=UPI001E3644FF|nr:chitosanase [Pseudonocardia kujensis]MCE0766475.1 chitosanase [Pseudonocardia kujensis]
MQRTLFLSREARPASGPSRPSGRSRFLAVLGAVVAGAVLVTAALLLLLGGAGSPGTAGTGGSPGGTSGGAAASERDLDRVIAQLVSVFENGTPDIQYAYVEDLHDGRGYTAGRAGFCTACGDLLTVVKSYTTRVPDNPLAGYVPTLTELAGAYDDSTGTLGGFADAWRTAADDPVFRQVQDQVTDALYVAPARKLADANGVRSALGLAALVDTAVEHGTQDGPDGLPALVAKTNEDMGGPPADGHDETAWLRDFLDIRRSTLENPSSADTSEVWSESVGRVDALDTLLDAGNLDLATPFTVNPWGDPQTITG